MGRKLLHIVTALAVSMILIMSGSKTADASHAMGADITYECLGGDTYKIRVSFYRDCIGINAPNSVYVNIVSQSCGQNLALNCLPIPGTGQEVTPLCPSAVSSCDGGIFTGIQEWIYEGIITLPMQCPDWTFSYSLCCRNAAITNIANPGSNTFYIYATLDNTVVSCNSSPTFSNKPVPFACLGEQFCFNHGAYDPDGDSLVYSLITPYQTAGTTVSYNAPFTATNPLTSSPNVIFNPATGDICMTPTNLEVTVMAVLVKEYRNGILIGTVERDIQVTVLNCNNSLPTLTGINGTNSFSTSVCAGDSLCFFINSNDPDPNQNVFITWDQNIPGATFTSSGGQHPTGTFCWVPTQAQISNSPYCFTVRVNDDACPMNGAQIYSYCITVKGVNVNAGPDQMIACNDFATVNVQASGGSGNYTYLWSNGVTLPIQTVPAGTYIVTVSDGQCSGQDTVVVTNAFVPTAAFTAVGTCQNSPVQFTDQSTLPGGIIISWNWNFGDGTTSTQQNPIHQFPGPGTYNVTFVIETNLGCIDTLVQPVTINPPPIAGFNAPSGCVGNTVTLTNTTTPAGAGNTWQWNLGNGQTSTAQNPTVTYNTPGTYNVTLIAIDSSGCADTITQPVTIFPLPIPAFGYSAIACEGGNVTFSDSSNANGGTITGWSWNFGNGQTSTSQNPTISFPTSGSYDVTLTVTNSNGCTATITQTITINDPPQPYAGPDQTICIGQSAILTASGGQTYNWSPGGMTGDNITVTPTTTTVYTVVVTDQFGCTATDTATVTVNPLPNIVASPDQSICIGQSATLTASGGTTYSWNPSGNSGGTITVTPGSSTTYAVTGTDPNGCSSTAFVNVTVNALPVVNLSNLFICSGNSGTLDAGNPGGTYQWSTGATTQTISVNNPGTYTVTVTNQFGCTTTGVSVVSQGGSIVNTIPNVSFCDGYSATLNAGNAGSVYQWSNGATTQTISVSSGGAYSVTITDQNGCTGTLSTTVNVNPSPVAQYTPADLCIQKPLQFVDQSTIASGSIVGWEWNFGDGNVSQQQSPSHNFSQPGVYNVTLVVTSNLGCVDSITQPFNVYPLPQANFSYNFACVGEEINFYDQSNVAAGNIVAWLWDFGNGTTSTQQNPSFTFAYPGMHTVTLTVTTAGGCQDSRPRIIHIYPLPALSFNLLSSVTCLGTAVNVVNTSTSSNGAINSWYWDFGNGTTSTFTNPSINYTTPGTYNVSLIGTTSHGCSDTIQDVVTVLPLPVAEAGANQIICIGESTSLTASGGVSYLWSTGATTATISLTPTLTQYYYVTVTDGNGCQGTDSVRVVVRDLPYAIAGPDKSICIGSSVTLTGWGTPFVNWAPGGQTTMSITVSPTTTTTYILTTHSLNGCSNTDTVTVFVNPLPTASAGPDQMICEGTTTSLSASGGVSYQWINNGSTAQTIYVNPALPTVYVVEVTDANGCKARDSVSVGLNPVPTANLSPAFICAGNSITLNAGNPGSTYLWSPGGETTQTIMVSDSGNFSVAITSPNGCLGVAATNVTIGGLGLNANPSNVQICAGETTVLNASNPGSTYQWSNGATSQSINVSTAGTYTVTITDPTGCSATFPNNVFVNPLPNLSFTSSTTCDGTSTQFTNTSTIATGNISTWLWSFGDGFNSGVSNPAHTYPSPGFYTVTLQGTSGLGCVSSLTQNVNIDPVPTADFTSGTVCLGGSTQFTDNSLVASGTISSWTWFFGDGTSGSTQNPVHTYTQPGIFTVSLIVSTGTGCSDSISYQVQVLDSPVPSFAVQPVCQGQSAQFVNTSTIAIGSITNYSWSFGDGYSSNNIDPQHNYTNAGSYNVTLTTVSDSGCSASVTLPLSIYPAPAASFTTTDVCDGSQVVFNNTSTISSGTITSTYWNFDDNSSSPLNSPSHLYAGAGTYQPYLVVNSGLGCADTAFATVQVHELPQAAFTSTDVCLGSPVILTDQSTMAGGSISTWSWNFGDGSTSAQQNPQHNFAAPGSYNISLVVSSNNGCVDTVSSTVNVHSIPVADFIKSDVCAGDAVSFADYSSVSGGGTLTSIWDFGDGTTGTGSNPQHIYTTPGIYQVTLTSTSQFGCSDVITKNVTIYAPPVASFSAQNACDGLDVFFTDLSTSQDGVISYWDWDLGDGTTSVSAAPVHIYPGPGSYQVTLTVTSIHGCTGTFTNNVQVYTNPVPVISAVSNCDGDPVTFSNITAAGDTTTYNYLWEFGDNTISYLQDPDHLYPGPGTYNVTLTMTTPNGCVASANTTVTVNPKPIADFEAINGCEGSAIQFNNLSTISSGTITGYVWDFGDGTALSSAVNPSHIFTSAGTYNVMLVAISDMGCTDTITQQVTVHPLPVPNFLHTQAEGCGPLTVYFTDSSYVATGNIVAWSWNFGNGDVSTLQNPYTVYTASGNYTVSLTVTTDKGCTETIVMPNLITIFPGPTANFTPDPFEASILNPVINFNNYSSGNAFNQWTFGDGTGSNTLNPIHTYQDTGHYLVTLFIQNTYGCVDSISQIVHIIPEFTVFVPNAFTPNGDGINDVFSLTGLGIIDITLNIFNRWGENIYTTDGYRKGWDGTVQKNDKQAQQDVYVYDAFILDVFGRTHHKYGTVTLVR